MQTRYDRCPNCMQALQGNEDVCTNCGFEISQYEEKTNCLRPFTVLQNKYMVGRIIGVGGFGITYIGWDLNLQTYIAIKEYFPESIASRDTSFSAESTQVLPNESKKEIYDKGLTRYVEEARNLSKFYQLQGIVSVKDFFYENGTGYIVMEYINGINLKEYLNNMGGKLDESTVLTLMKPVFESLYQMHNSGLVHRDISPDNIMVDSDGKIKLIDFGSARGQSAAGNDKTYTVILKHGYAPPEQYYAKGNQGPWTDIYGLCATMYKMLTGQVPPNSVERMENDEYVGVAALGINISPRTEAVLRKGLAVKLNERYQNIGQLLQDLYGTQPVSVSGGNDIPIAKGAAFAGPASLSQQSMHLNMGDNGTSADNGKKNKIIMYAAIAAIVVVAIVGMVLLVSGGKKNKKDNPSTEAGSEPVVITEEGSTGDTTETTEATETEATEEAPEGYKYVWPDKLSDDWRDYTINIEGTVYKFPMPYEEWASKGWKSDRLPTDLPAGDYDYADFHIDKVELTALFLNPTMNEASIDECWVIGVSIDTSFDDVASDAVIELPKGIKLLVSGEDDIKKAFGAPEYRYEGTDLDDNPYVSLDYAGDDSRDGMDFEINSEGKLSSISIANTAIPEEAVGSADISTEPPEINSLYVAPSGPSTDRFDNIITLDGVNYVLPVTVVELTENGWALDTATEDYISGNSYENTYMEKDGNKIAVEIRNYTANAILPMNGYITSIEADKDYCSLEVVFPGGVKLGMNASEFEPIYSDLGDDYKRDDWGSTIYYSVYYSTDNGYISIYSYEDSDTGLIKKYQYKNNVRNIR